MSSFLSIFILMCCIGGVVLGLMTSIFRQVKKRSLDNDIDAEQYVYSTFGELINEVKPMYDAGGRYYHNWDHIQEGLDFIIKYYPQLLGTDSHAKSRGERLILAWLFHDVIYSVDSTENEHKSGMFALDTLSYISKFDCIGLDKIIEATIDHKRYTPCLVTDLLCDIDLMRLGADWDTFMKYTDQVYYEYKLRIPDKNDFLKARALFFSKFLSDRGAIFKTQFMRDMYERQAQSNIRRFIAEYSK